MKESEPITIKIAIIGAGSIGFTRKLIHDIAAVPELADTTFHLMDISQHNLAMEAAVSGNVTLLKQAMLHDPLVGAVCNPEEVWQMTDEMLVAQAQWLPQYAT